MGHPNLRPYNIEHDVHGNQILYRSMSSNDFNTLKRTGQLPATGETFISPSQAYASGYNGVLVRFTVKPNTVQSLMSIGVTGNSSTRNNFFPHMPRAERGWGSNNQVQFKFEGQNNLNINQGNGVVNTGLGRSDGLRIFNENILKYEPIYRK